MFRLKDGVVIEEVIGDEGIIVDTNRGQYLKTNKTALMMITAATQTQSVEDAVIALSRLTDADTSVIERDLRALLGRLVEMNLLEHIPTPTQSSSE